MLPPDIGDLAPALEPPPTDESGRAPAILAFHPRAWDPARADVVDIHRVHVADGNASRVQRILLPNDCPLAYSFGVASTSAVFLIDSDGRVVWRHVSGIDALHRAVVLAAGVPLHEETQPDETERPNGWSRREFVLTTMAAALALALEPVVRRAEAATDHIARITSVGDAQAVTLNVNGRKLSLMLEPRVTLLDALREYAGLTGSKKGCDHGQCGACTVHIDGRRTLSCLTFAVMHQDEQITTIEGLAASVGATGDALHPMQRAFIEHDGFQCGYCTSGQIMSACAVVKEPWGPADDDVREAMSGNICRCGAYPGILAAVQDVRRNNRAESR